MEEKKRKIDTEILEEEYMEHLDTDNDELYWAKECLKNKFSKLQRKIYITYLECGTYAATAKIFKVSTPTVKKYVQNLNQIIIDYICNNI